MANDLQLSVGKISDVPHAAGQCLPGQTVRNYPLGGAAAKVATVTVSTAADDTAYAFTSVCGSVISVTSGTGATKTSIRDLLIDAINADATAGAQVFASAKDADEFYVTAQEVNDDFAITESDSNLALTISTAASGYANVRPGIAVEFTAAGAVIPATSGSAKIAGIALKSQSIRPTDAGLSYYSAQEGVPCVVHGPVPVLIDAAETPSPGDDVYVRHTATSPEVIGACRTDADTSDAKAWTGAEWLPGGAQAALGSELICLLNVRGQ